MMEEMGQLFDEMNKAGVLLDTAGLGGTAESTQLRWDRGKLTVVDATNVRPEARKPLVQLARDHHVPLLFTGFEYENACSDKEPWLVDVCHPSKDGYRRMVDRLLPQLAPLLRPPATAPNAAPAKAPAKATTPPRPAPAPGQRSAATVPLPAQPTRPGATGRQLG